jgi:small subunit ribosomal protein S16
MKPMGRKHRHYYRIVAIDGRQPNDGRIIEELGTYDPHVADVEKTVTLKPDRVRYWQSVGALASEKVTVLLNKFMAKFDAPAASGPAEGEKKEGKE